MTAVPDTIAALATPVGTSAIALIRVSGPGAAELIRGVFGEVPEPRTAVHADYRSNAGELIDDVLFTYFAGPNSYTGEDVLEISCHGNPFIAQSVLEDLYRRGCRPAEPGEFTKRAFLGGRMDLSQAEAVMDLIHARSERALEAANQQLRGSLGRRMGELINLLVNILAQIEAYIDFPEEDLPPERLDAVLGEIDALLRETGRLLATNHYGDMLRDGIKTVIIGEPNAGKSSLLNRLVGRERALVSDEPGTTRDYLEERINLGPHSLRLIDTAGLNTTPTPLERRGIDKTLEQAGAADLYLWVIDSTRAVPRLPDALASRMTALNSVAVFNKSDLVTSPHSNIVPFPAVSLSALTGSGVDQLESAVAKLADAFAAGVGEDMVAINARHARALTAATQCLGSARDHLSRGEPTELVASELRGAMEAFGEISGRIDNERILDRLFASFCIGK